MPYRACALAVVLSLAVSCVLSTLPGAGPQPVAAAGEKVVIIVGPVGSLTNTYRSMADKVGTAAASAGASVVKVYSPNATWANVRSAVHGANVVVYFGHGNGYPNPYGEAQLRDRTNGLGLNTATTNGDADSWSAGTLVYCGEKAFLGTLTSTDGAAQRTHCSGGPLTPAAGFTMVYAQAHYAPGFGERYVQSDPLTTLAEAQQRVRNYSRPILQLGAGAFFATAYGDADQIVSRVLTQPTTAYGELFRSGRGYSASTATTVNHPDVGGAQYTVQRTSISGLHFGEPDYWYAHAGDPGRTPAGTSVLVAPRIEKVRPNANSTNARIDAIVSATFDQPVVGVSGATFFLKTAAGAGVPATVSYNTYWKRAELRTAENLQPGSTYVATVTNGITSTTGQAVAQTSWRFTTEGAAPAPDGSEIFNPPVRLVFRQGTHTGYRFDAAGAVTGSRTMTLARDSGASTSHRTALLNQSGTWFYIVDGAWAGHWIRESNGLSFAATATTATASLDATYQPPTRIAFRQGTHTGYAFSATGAVQAEKTFTLAWDSGASASARRTVANQYGSWFAITNGVWAGYLVRESDVIHLP